MDAEPQEFPFSAIVGMELAKTSLLLHAVDPALGGVLLSGHRGSAKTTLARAFGKLMEDFGGVACTEIPLGATEDRVLGSVDVSSVLEKNDWHLQEGLLAQAHGGVLYIDEINLLTDALSDQLLDAAATGSYRLEREGFSRRIASRFILIGSMNPEEGDLRPQLTDRFAHSVRITSDLDESQRTEILERRLAFERDPGGFAARFAKEQAVLARRIEDSRERLGSIHPAAETLRQITARATGLHLEGMRAEIAVLRTAIAHAAWRGADSVNDDDIDLAWKLCLPHRLDEFPPDEDPAGGSKNQSTDPEADRPAESGPRSFLSLHPSGSRPDPIRREIVSDPAQSARVSRWLSENRGESGIRRRPDLSEPVRVHASDARRFLTDISWRASVLGWIRDGHRNCLRRRRRPRSNVLWMLIDASRSSGASGFIGRLSGTLRAALKRHRIGRLRCEALRLHRGRVDWFFRKLPAPLAAGRFSETPPDAAGGSPLEPALRRLLRECARSGAKPGDRIVIASDGLASLREGDSPEKMRHRLRQILLRLARTGLPVLWLFPATRRGLVAPPARLGLEKMVSSFDLR